jgi:hypothetical protein
VLLLVSTLSRCHFVSSRTPDQELKIRSEWVLLTDKPVFCFIFLMRDKTSLYFDAVFLSEPTGLFQKERERD